MKRNVRKPRRSDRHRRKTNPGSGGTADSPSPQSSRREILASVRNWGLLGLLAAGGGWYLVDEVTATFAEHDLSRIGNGAPAIVQIHDPECPRCRSLQRETRKALKAIGDDRLQYLVANIRSAEGRKLAAAHGVGHVTLLLFDGDGRRRDILSGVRNSKSLETIFRAHARQSDQN